MRYDKDNIPPYHDKSLTHASTFIKPILRANDYLLKSIKKTRAKQFREYQAEGVILNKSVYYKLREGRHRTINVSYLCYFVIYWNKSLFELYDIGMKVMNGELE